MKLPHYNLSEEQICLIHIIQKKAGIDPAILPEISSQKSIGCYRGQAEVYPAIGDNQASFIGSCKGDVNCMLTNIGTGGQFSVYTKDYMSCPGLETRPFPNGGYLIVGSSLCGGRAYDPLEEFFLMTAKLIVSGNVLRRNIHLRRCSSEKSDSGSAIWAGM